MTNKGTVSVEDTLVALPPQGFYFVTKHTTVDNVPVIYFALQEDGTSNTVSIRVNPQEIETNAATLNSIQKLLGEMWQKEYADAPSGPDVNDFIDYGQQKSDVSGEMV